MKSLQFVDQTKPTKIFKTIIVATKNSFYAKCLFEISSIVGKLCYKNNIDKYDSFLNTFKNSVEICNDHKLTSSLHMCLIQSFFQKLETENPPTYDTLYTLSQYIYIQSIYFPISFVLRCISSYITPFFPVLLISSYILPFIRILLYILFNTIGFVLFLKYNGSVLRKIQRMGVVLVSLPVCLLRFVVLFSFIKLMFDRLFKRIILIIIIVYQSLKISTVVFCRS